MNSINNDLGSTSKLSYLKKHWKIAFVLIILALVGSRYAYGAFFTQENNEVEVEFQTAKVKKGDVNISFSAEGVVVADVIDLNFGSGGIITEVLVNEGDFVEKGAVLAKLDVVKLAEQVNQASANVQKTTADLDKLKNEDLAVKEASITSSQKQLEGQKELSAAQIINAQNVYSQAVAKEEEKLDELKNADDPDSDLITKQEEVLATVKQIEQDKLDSIIISENQKIGSIESQIASAEKQYAQTEASIKPQEAVLASNNAAVNSARASYDSAILIAPEAGQIVQISAKAGESSPSGATSMMRLKTSDVLVMQAYLEDVEAMKTSVDMKVNILLDSLEDEVFEGKVAYTSPIAEIDQSGWNTYKTLIQINQEGEGNLPLDGMSGEIEFVTKEIKDVLYVPVDAIENRDGKYFVKIGNAKDLEGSAEEKEVVVGFTNGTDVEIKEGLVLGDSIIVPIK